MALFLRGLLSISTLIVLSSCQLPRPAVKDAPAHWTDRTYTSPDGSVFPYSRWLPASQPHAVVLAIHGLGGAASDWEPLGTHLVNQSIAVYAPELRSMGNDPEPRRVGALDRRQAWQDDLASFAHRVRLEHPDVPLYWHGESLGGIVSLPLLDGREARAWTPQGMILASPIVQIHGKIPPSKEWMLRAAARLAPNWKIDLQRLAPNDAQPAQVVSTTTHTAQLEHTPHAVTHFSLRTLDEIRYLVVKNQALAPHLKLPLLLIHGGQDVFTAPPEVPPFFLSIGSPEKHRLFYPDGYHLLLHDVGREQVLNDIAHWLRERIRVDRAHWSPSS